MAASRFSRAAFDALVRRALEAIPDPFRRRLDNVTVTVQDRPARKLLREMGCAADETIYGLYEGTPLIERDVAEPPLYPDRVTIFREPLEEDFGDDADEIVRQIRITVIHEIGHHFGLTDDDMEHMEEG